MKFIIFRFCLVLFPAEFVHIGIYLLVLGSARLRWVLRAAAGFCLLLLCSAWCCLLLLAAVGFWVLSTCADFAHLWRVLLACA